MRRKTFLLLLVLLAGACVVFAAGQGEEAEGQVVLKVWGQFMEEGAQVGAATAIEQMGKSFMVRNPNVKVERTPMAVEEMTNTLKPRRPCRHGCRESPGDSIPEVYRSSSW